MGNNIRRWILWMQENYKKLRPVREVVELQEHFTIGCTTVIIDN